MTILTQNYEYLLLHETADFKDHRCETINMKTVELHRNFSTELVKEAIQKETVLMFVKPGNPTYLGK